MDTLYSIQFFGLLYSLVATGHAGVERKAMWTLGVVRSTHCCKEVFGKVGLVWPATRHGSSLSNGQICI